MKFEFPAAKFDTIGLFSKCGAFAVDVVGADGPESNYVNTVDEIDRLGSPDEEDIANASTPKGHYDKLVKALQGGEQVLCLLTEPLLEDDVQCADGKTYQLDSILNDESPSIQDTTLHLLVTFDAKRKLLMIETWGRDFGDCMGPPSLFEVDLNPAFGRAIKKWLSGFVG